jgi:hypothetical protein
MSFFFGCECWMVMEGSEYVGMLSSFPYALQCIQVVSTGALERIVLRFFPNSIWLLACSIVERSYHLHFSCPHIYLADQELHRCS